MGKTLWLDRMGKPMDINDASKEAKRLLPTGATLTPEQLQQLSEWLRQWVEHSDSAIREMAGHMLSACTATENPTLNISGLMRMLSNSSLKWQSPGVSRAYAEFISRMVTENFGIRLTYRSVNDYNGRKVWRVEVDEGFRT